jgi:hypothetical protein
MGTPLTFTQALEQAEALAQQALPQVCHERIACGMALVKNGHVLQRDDGTWEVQSATTEGKVYAVNGSCPCEDAHFRAPKGLCKHRLSVQLFRRAVSLMQPQHAPEAPQEEPLGDARSALGEAPSSINLKVLLYGHECQLTLRDEREDRLLQRLEALLKNKDIRPLPKPAPRPQGQQWRSKREYR